MFNGSNPPNYPGGGLPPPPPPTQQQNRVKVEDALSYLEDVKNEFQNRPEVYTQFLDIMKDFKSQTIDTPGVIQRVSSLFNEYPRLILGFNAFLPPGFEVRYMQERIVIVHPNQELEEIPQSSFYQSNVDMNGYEGEEGVAGEYVEDEHIGDEEYYDEEGDYDERMEDEEGVGIGEYDDGVGGVEGGQMMVDENGMYDEEEEEEEEVGIEDEEGMEDEEEAAEYEDEEESEEYSDEEEEEDQIDDVLTRTGKIAYKLVAKVKARFAEQKHIYVQFLDLLVYHLKAHDGTYEDEFMRRTKRFMDEETRLEFVISAVTRLFASEPDLLEDFMRIVELSADPSLSSEDSDTSEDSSESDENEEEEGEEKEKREGEGKQEEKEEEEEEEAEIKMEEEEKEKEEEDKNEDNEKIERQEGGEEKVETRKERKERKRKERVERKKLRVEAKMKEREENASTLKRINHLINHSQLKLYQKLQETLELNDVKKVLLMLNIFVCKHINRDELVRGLREIIGNRSQAIFFDLCDLLGLPPDLGKDSDDDDFEDDDDEDEEEEEEEEENDYYMDEPAVSTSTSSPTKPIYPSSRRAFGAYGAPRDINESTIACLGVSYRHIQRDEKIKCSGRTQLCDEVLNDEWTSYPSWSSEDNGNVSSKKSPYEEFLYRTEDERFELDIVLDVNKYAIESLELINRKMEKMSDHERSMYKLDVANSVTSLCLLTRAIRRIYGEAASYIMNGLRENPVVAVPRTLQRCQEKEREWRESQTQMNKMWREQLEKQLTRSLDHQTALTKQADARLLKPKSMIHQVEQFFDTRQGKDPENDVGPHLMLTYPEKRKILHDVNDIMIHYLKRQPGYSKDDKRRMKIILRKIVLEWFCERPAEMSDDEKDEDLNLDKKKSRREEATTGDDRLEYNSKDQRINLISYYADDETDEWPVEFKYQPTENDNNASPIDEFLKDQEQVDYRLFFGDDSMYIFVRLHHTLTDRFARFHAAYVRKCDDFHDQNIYKRQWENEYGKSNNKLMAKVEKDWGVLDDKLNVLRKTKNSPLADYHSMLCDVKRYLNGEIDASSFEDALRATFPNEGCMLLSIDKILMLAVKTLSTLANNEDECSAMKMYMRHRLRKPPTRFLTSDFVEGVEQSYQKLAEERLHGKNCYKFEMTNDKGDPSVSITLLDTEDSENEEEEDDVEDDTIAASSASSAESIMPEEASLTVGGPEKKRTKMWDGSVHFDEEDEEYIRKNRSKKSRRTIMKGRQSGDFKAFWLKRNKRNLNPNQLQLFDFEMFEESDSPISEHRGGFYVKQGGEKNRQTVLDSVREMQKRRRDRCKLWNVNAAKKCDLLELNTVKTQNNPNPNPDFSFLVFNRYESA